MLNVVGSYESQEAAENGSAGELHVAKQRLTNVLLMYTAVDPRYP
jgi:hypothetical protein